MTVSPTSITIDLARDAAFDEISLQTLKDRYLVEGETSPQHGFARASAAFADDEAHAQRLYDYVSKGWFMFATPLLSNGGTDRGLPISCYLALAEDSRKGIFDHWTEVGWLSSEGGGVGGYWPIRSNGTKTSRGSKSTGMIPFIATVDRLILSVSQGGTRRGSYAAYVDIHHPEVLEFIGFRKPAGDQNRKGLNLHNALNITDEFMCAVRDNTTFDLRDVKTGKVTESVVAREVWKYIIETRKQTGEPYLFFVDAANRGLPEAQRKKGLRVNQSNLCVGPQTELLTRGGYKPIGALAGETLDVWNGEDWSEIVVEQTNKANEKQEMVRVSFDDGSFLDCTPYHKFYDIEGTMIRAGELEYGVALEAFDHPVIRNEQQFAYEPAKAYTAGYATFSGFEENNRLTVFSTEDNRESIKELMQSSVDSVYDEVAKGLYIRYETGTIPAGQIPLNWTPESRLAWLGGAMDAVGDWVESDDNEVYLTLATLDVEFVRSMRLAFLEVGLHPKIRIADSVAAFMLHPYDVNRLGLQGYIKKHVYNADDPIAPPSIAVVNDVVPLPWKSDTYCFTEQQRGRGVFNGILTGNCTEITLPTGRDDTGRMRTAVCCLSSVNAEKFDEWVDNPNFIEDLMRMLDNCLDVFITKARPEMANAVYAASQERSVGLGLLGFHAYLQRHNVAFESEEARAINKKLFRHLKAGADQASLALGTERGEAPDMIGTGERFAHKIAVAPNASSSILCGNTSPSIEPFRANAYLQKTLSGSFPSKNPYLVKALAKLGLDTPAVWAEIIGDEGSIQNLGQFVAEGEDSYQLIHGVKIPAAKWQHTCGVFRTFPEIDMLKLVQLAVDRTPEICQAQSVNLAFDPDADAGYMSEAHYNAWEGGLKSLYYLRSSSARRGENTNTKVERIKMDEYVEEPVGAQLSANPADDSTCIACEG